MWLHSWDKHVLPLIGTLASGGLCMLAFPGSPAPVLAFVCMVPWLVGIRSTRPGIGMVSGLMLGGFYAMPCTWNGIYAAAQTLNVSAGRAGLLTALFFIPYMLPFAVIGWYATTSRLVGGRWAFGGSALWVAAMFAIPTLFPVTPGLMLHRFPAAIQLADVGGVPLVNFGLFLINFLLAEIVRLIGEHRSAFKEVVSLALILTLAGGYGWLRLATFREHSSDATRRRLSVALIQPNLPYGVNESGLIRDNRTHVASALEMTRRVLQTTAIDLAVFPETAVNAACGESGLVFRKLSAVAKETGVTFLYQCVDCQDSVCYNSAQMVLPSEPSPGLYRKRALIPFLETMPTSGWLRHVIEVAPTQKAFQAGTAKAIFQMEQGIRVMPLICYDVHFPALVRQGDIGNVIAVLANDQRFGRSRIGYLDYAMTIFRAVEIRRPLVRVTNTGPSAIIQASGETVPGTLTPIFQPATRTTMLTMPVAHTIYARHGDLFLYFMDFISCLLLWQRIHVFCLKRFVKNVR